MASELVKSATSDKLKELDWAKNIEICELVSRDNRQSKNVINAIKKRLGSKNPNTQLFAATLLEMLMNNCGEHVHQQVIDNGILPILVKIVKKKSDIPVREKIFLLLDATQTSLGGASGKFPQYYAAYYDLVCARVQFPQHAARVPAISVTVKSKNDAKLPVTEPNAPSNGPVAKKPVTESESVTNSSIIEKANIATEILRDVLDALDPGHPEGATDEFTLDLVEQFSFQKQRVMHIAMTCRDEKLVSRAIELNEQLDKLLVRHDALLSVRCQPDTYNSHFEDEVEDPDQQFRRLRKGKACITEKPEAFVAPGVSPEMLHRPLIRPLTIDAPMQNDSSPPNAAIPPPPSKHVEREKYFKEKQTDGSLAGHIRHLSLHSSNGSSSRSDITDLSE